MMLPAVIKYLELGCIAIFGTPYPLKSHRMACHVSVPKKGRAFRTAFNMRLRKDLARASISFSIRFFSCS